MRVVDLLEALAVDVRARLSLNDLQLTAGYVVAMGKGQNAVLHKLFQDAQRSAAISARRNAYQSYLEAIESGSPVSKTTLDGAFKVVNARFLRSARAAGYNIKEVHHWNFDRNTYAGQIVDPRHLIPIPFQIPPPASHMLRRGLHYEIHAITASDPSTPYAGPILRQHELTFDSSITPLAGDGLR